MDQAPAYYFFISWIGILIAFWGATKFEGTRTIIYYLLILLIVLDLVSHSTEINDILRAGGLNVPSTDVLGSGGAA